MIKAFIFDMDGTLVDTEVLWVDATECWLREQGFDVERGEVIDLVYGIAWRDVYAEALRRYPGLN
ncbi:MAG TPA: HAD family phosphatase, partial [Candidatus Hydrogenedentes bacterium]|nr:HAD family phosphatase [Candidatus Hydrogenedentota bacterium]